MFLIGLDGATWDLIGPLLAQGRLPNLERLVRNGSSGDLRSIEPMLSPVVWTTIATGKLPQEHGITDFHKAGYERQTAVDRKSRALWNILSEQGRSVLLVSYMTTWPAERVRGTVISDLPFNFPTTPIRSQLNYPSDALNEYEKVHPISVLNYPPPAIRRFVIDRWQPFYETARGDPEEYRYQKMLAKYLAPVHWRDETVTQIAEFLLRRDTPDFFAIHLWGIDRTSHGFWKYMEPGRPDVTAREYRRMGAIVPKYYVYADEVIGRLMKFADANTTVFVVSDHGFTGIPASVKAPNPYMSGDHAPNGVLMAFGSGIRTGQKLAEASVLDIAPTILSLLGLPVPDDMHGKVLTSMMTESAPPRRIKSYETDAKGAAPAAPAASLSPEEIESLKAMGYLQ